MLYPLRFSMAYGGKPKPLAPAADFSDTFLGGFGEEAVFLTAMEGLAEQLTDEGAEPRRGWGYGSRFSVTPATFEVALVALDWERAGLFVATDED
jgi:hypothetical protein